MAEVLLYLSFGAPLVLLWCSPNSAKSEWVGKEIEFFR